MNVGLYMQPGVITLLPDAALSVVRDTMDSHGFGLLLVADAEGALKGFVTRAGLKDVKDWEAAVESVAHPVRFSVTPEDTLEKAALILLSNRLVLLPVVKDGVLVGVLTQAEVLRGFSHALGIGQAAVRFSVPTRNGPLDLYPVMDVLRKHGATLISLVRSPGHEEGSHMILRVQNVEDKETLRAELEMALRGTDVT